MSLNWLLAFALTLLLETPVYVFGLRRALSLPRAAGIAVVLNAVTHPPTWWLSERSQSLSVFAATTLAAVLVEAALVWLAARKLRAAGARGFVDAYAVSLVANLLSAGFGLLLQ